MLARLFWGRMREEGVRLPSVYVFEQSWQGIPPAAVRATLRSTRRAAAGIRALARQPGQGHSARCPEITTLDESEVAQDS